MAAQVVYSSTNQDNEAPGTLFNGIKFWLSQKVPMRSSFIADIRACLHLPDAVTYLIFCLDKWGRDRPPREECTYQACRSRKKRSASGQVRYRLPYGVIVKYSHHSHSHSYRFVESSIRNAALEDLADHVVGPPEGTIRPVGSMVRPGKSTRNPYTQEDERILWDWVHAHIQQGGGTDGNEIYKQLEAKVRDSRRFLSPGFVLTIPRSILSIHFNPGVIITSRR